MACGMYWQCNADKFCTLLQMHDFVVNVLGWTQANGTQQTPYGSHLGMYGNHVGFVLFNDTVCLRERNLRTFCSIGTQRASVELPQY